MFCYKIKVQRGEKKVQFNILNKNDEIVMSLVHYFITEENYTPIVVR